ncbi:MAG: T9SS type A sorting domain-containing protein, partial [Bacteroidota bacterium]
GSIAGRMYTEYCSAVQNTEVRIENIDNAMLMTPASGNYAFDLSGSANYTVVPTKNTGVLNGVSTFDMVRITKHILGKDPFTSPYQFIAADVNGSGDVSTFDIIQLRKLILNLITEFPDDMPSWRFIDAGYEFTTEAPAAEAFPESIQINNLNGTIPDLDFIAIKLGDINGSAAANATASAESRTTTDNMVIEIEDRTVEAGEIIEVPFGATAFKNIEGYQFTLQFEGLELQQFIEGVATEANFGFGLQERGYLVTSWNNLSTQANADAPELFRLKFKATQNGKLADLLAINSAVTTSESYHSNGSLLGVELKAKPVITTFDLAQNTPNPFTTETTIGFELPAAAVVELNIIDLQGKVVQTQRGDFAKGAQRMVVSANELPNGTYYYQLVTPFGVAAKKMIVLR